MPSGSGFEASLQKSLERDLVNVGNKLLSLDSSTDEVFSLLERAESLLSRVWQQPPKRLRRALLPLMKALIADDLLHNHDTDIQVILASCFNELTRISAPHFTYPDDLTKEIFRLFIISFNQLSSESNHNYSRALKILETMVKVKSSLMLVDIDSDGLINEMFQLFLNTDRSVSDHQSDIFKYMEATMSLVIEEIDSISKELLSLLLDSVRLDSKTTSPFSWKLGRKVIKNCGAKLHCHLQLAVKTMNLDVGDYAEIVASVLNNRSSGNTMLKMILHSQKTKFLEKKKARKSLVDYGEKLVNSRIKVWWPMDGTFYPGKVKAFDPDTKKHVVLYDDNEVEILDLRKETWKLVMIREEDERFQNKVPVKSVEEKSGKRKPNVSIKSNAIVSSKRSKVEGHTVNASEEQPEATNSGHVNEDDFNR